uniref:Uncharacterized protein n=1 Tax=Anguilla anguilla TaxID=7936 RepID=A0A0E9V2R3_ANGAN
MANEDSVLGREAQSASTEQLNTLYLTLLFQIEILKLPYFISQDSI